MGTAVVFIPYKSKDTVVKASVELSGWSVSLACVDALATTPVLLSIAFIELAMSLALAPFLNFAVSLPT
jgi:hypothetical protein